MSVSRSVAKPRWSRLSIAAGGFLARMCRSACRATDWLCGDCPTRLRSQHKEGQMKSAAKEAKEPKQESKALVFIEVTGVIVAYIAIIASLAYPVVTAASWAA